MRVILACNDERNGLFAGRFDALMIEDEQNEIVLSIEGEPIRLISTNDNLRIMNRKFPTGERVDWFGNWCWNAYEMEPKDVASLLNILRLKLWDCVEWQLKDFEKKWSDKERLILDTDLVV